MQIIYQTREYLNKKSLKLIFHTLIYPSLIYCNSVWGGATDVVMRELQLVLKRVVRAMSFAAYREHSLPLFNDIRIFTMTNINKYMSSLFVYKALGKENQMFDIVANANYNLRSNHQMLLQVPNIRTAHSRQGVEWRGSRSGTPSLQRSGCPLPMIPLSAGRRGFCWESRQFRHCEYQLRFLSPSILPSLYGCASSLCILCAFFYLLARVIEILSR